MANKAINRAFLKDALQSYNERLDDAVVGALTTDIVGEDDAATGAKKGIQTLTVVDNSDTTIDLADREKLLTIVPAINELDREIGDTDLTVVDNSDSSVAAEDRPVLVTITEAVNELDRKQGDADLTVVDTTADPAETDPKDNISDAINVLDKEIGDAATITVEDTTNPIYDPTAPEYDPDAVLAPEIEVVSSLNVLDKELGDTNTITVIDVIAGEDKAKKVAVNAINTLDKEMGDAELTVLDTVAGKADAETEARSAINVLDKELGDVNTITIVDTTNPVHDPDDPAYDPDAPLDPEKEVVSSLNVLDKEIGDANTITVIDNTADPAKTKPEKEVVAAINVLDKEIGDLTDITVIDTTATPAKTDPEKQLVPAVNVLDKEIGDAATITVIDTIANPTSTTAENVVVDAINVLDKELGENKDLDVTILEKDTVVDAINSVRTQAVVTITESVPTPADPDYKTVLKTYTFTQDFESDGITPHIIGKIDLAKDLVVTSGEAYTADGTETYPSSGEPCGLEAGKVYIKLMIANQDDPVYIDVRDLYNDYTVEEDAAKVQLAITPERKIFADIVPNSLGHDDFLMTTNKELNFTGFDHLIDTAFPEHYEICSDSTYGALLVVSGAPQGNQIALATVQAINAAAGWGEHIEVGMYVIHKEAIAPGTPQLTTTAQNLREAVNELDVKQGDEVITVVDATGVLTTTLSAAVNALDAKQGDETLTTTAQTISGAINEHDAEIGDLADLTTTAKDTLVNAINELDAKQGDDALTTTAQDLSAAVNELNTTKTVTVTATAEPLPAGISKSYDINQTNTDGTVDKKGTIEIPYSNYTEAENPVTVQVTVDNTDGVRTIGAEVIDGSIGRTQLDEDTNDELNFLDKATELTTTEKASVTKAINEVNLMKDVTVEEQETPGPGVAKAFDIKQKDATGADVVRGTIEIPFSNYEGEDTDTIDITVDNTDGSRKISASVVDASIDTPQLSNTVNNILNLIPEKVTYKDTVSYIDFTDNYKDTALKNDLYIIDSSFTISGKSYAAGSWAICTNAPIAGSRTWAYINNGGKSTIVKAITNEEMIAEVRDAEGKVKITDVIGDANVNDPQDTMYMIATEGIIKFAPHHGIYLKTADAGGTAVAEIFDFGVGGEGGGITYVGSEGTNIKVTVTTLGTTGTIGASIVLGSLSKGLMDAEINAILNFTGYPTSLTTAGQTLAEAVNEHDKELGNVNYAFTQIKTGECLDVAAALMNIATNNITWDGTINTAGGTMTYTATEPLKRGYVYNVRGADTTINGLPCSDGDWILITNNVPVGGQPTFIKLGSFGGGAVAYNDAGPLTVFS